MQQDELIHIVYDELRSVASAKLAKLPPGNTLPPTALVHEVYAKIQRSKSDTWTSPGHYFATAAEAMRQILVDQARFKYALKSGGGRKREAIDANQLEGVLNQAPEVVLTVNDALDELEKDDKELASIVRLRFFAGLSMTEIASSLEIPRRTLQRRWRFAAAHLRRCLIDAGLDEAAIDVEET